MSVPALGRLSIAVPLLALLSLPSCRSSRVDPARLDDEAFEAEVVRRFQYPPPQPEPREVADPGAGQAADAAYFAEFPDLDRAYTPAARSQAKRLAAALRREAASLTHEQFVLRVAEIAALADNGHTAPDPVGFWKNTPRLPLRTFPFADGLRVLRAKGHVADLVGARIDAIDGRPVDEVFVALRRYQGGLDGRRRRLFTPLLESPALLEAAGLAGERRALTLRGVLADGTPFERRVEAEERERSAPIANVARLLFPPIAGATPEGMTASFPLPEPPVSLRHGGRLFSSAPLPGGGHFVQLGHNSDGDEEPIGPFLDGVLADVDRLRPRFVVVDLRLDGGGDYTKTYRWAKELLRKTAPAGRIYVLTSPTTFSAAITTAAVFVENGGPRVTVIGEPVGDRLAFWAEGGALTLPNSFLRMYYTAGKHDYAAPCDDVDDCFWLNARFPVRVRSLEPAIAAPWTFEAYRTGHDPAFDAVAEREAVAER